MRGRRRLNTRLGQLLRTARQALDLTQGELARLAYTSTRQISRWENGLPPHERGAEQLASALGDAPGPVIEELRRELGIANPEPTPRVEVAAEPPPLPPPVTPLPPPKLRPSADEIRSSLERVMFTMAEERDLLPRHLRAFAAALLREMERLEVSASEAAEAFDPGRAAVK